MKSLTLKNQEPKRLDVALSERLKVSRTKIQKAIKIGAVLINGKVATAHFEVNLGDKISYDPQSIADKQKSIAAPTSLNIVYEDADVIVVNKPAGVIAHDTETNTEPTLVDALIKHDKKIAEVGDNKERAGLVHRLDKAASGIMIVAKHQKAFEILKQKFANREVQKKYTVLVRGHMPESHGTIDFPIERSKSNGRMAARLTHYDSMQTFPHHTLLDVKIDTGRTHQIRAHMFALGSPVVGDTLYRQKGVTPSNIGRIFLHARELTIELPNGETKTFTAPLPEELKQVLNEIPKL